jgi:Fanconi anemia group M protein
METSWSELGPYDRLVNTELVEPRAYQISIIKSVYGGRNTLVVLPTGLGKTLIAVFAMAKALHSGKKALFLAPTKPLSEQHCNSLAKMLKVDSAHLLLLTGSMAGNTRKEREADAKVIAATPQTFSNDLKRGRVGLEDFGIVVFDECHRAVGRYAYTYIADECRLRGVQLIGLTASPGSDKKKIGALIDTLGIENIEIRITEDADVEQYVMRKDIRTYMVEKGPVVESVLSMLKPVIDDHLTSLYSHGLSPFRNFEKMPKGRLLQIGDAIRKIQAKNYKFMGVYDYVYVLDLAHAYDLAATEGLYPFVSYFESLESRETKSRVVKSIIANASVRAAVQIARDALNRSEEHPKMPLMAGLLGSELGGKSVIVFAQYRSTTKKIVEVLGKSGIAAREFVGKRTGMTQAQQQQTLNQFRNGEFKVLVATSIGEEGLDIPAVDAVVFYEPVPNEIRSIQRKGRAGRMKFGTIIILAAKGTKDEAYLFISRVKEKRMRETVLRIKEGMDRRTRIPKGEAGQRSL